MFSVARIWPLWLFFAAAIVLPSAHAGVLGADCEAVLTLESLASSATRFPSQLQKILLNHADLRVRISGADDRGLSLDQAGTHRLIPSVRRPADRDEVFFAVQIRTDGPSERSLYRHGFGLTNRLQSLSDDHAMHVEELHLAAESDSHVDPLALHIALAATPHVRVLRITHTVSERARVAEIKVFKRRNVGNRLACEPYRPYIVRYLADAGEYIRLVDVKVTALGHFEDRLVPVATRQAEEFAVEYTYLVE